MQQKPVQNNRMFEEMLRAARERVKRHAPKKIAENSGIMFLAQSAVYQLESLGETVKITYPKYTFSPDIAEWHQLVILHYMDLADGSEASQEMMPFSDLKDGLIRGTKFDHDAERVLQSFLQDKSEEQVLLICKKLGADVVEDRADLCVVFHFLPQYPVWLKIWFADEEFAASGKLFVSKSADHYLSIEDAVTVGGILLEKLI